MATAVLADPPKAAPPKGKPKKLPLEVKIPVGALAGMVGTTCMFPFDIVKTRLQAAKGSLGPIEVAKNIFKTEGGFKGFYRGLLPNLVCVGPEKAIKLVVNETLREKFENDDGSIDVGYEILAGGTAGSFQAVVTVPMELTKIQMQLQETLPAAERQTLGQVIKGLGLAGLYRGTAATLLRDIPYSVLFFPGYANIRKLLADKDGKNSGWSTLFAGGAAGSIAAGLVTPFDTIKTNLQKKGGMEKYKDIKTCCKMLIEENKGNKWALFKGVVPRMIVVGPLFAITLLSFEKMKEYMERTGKL